MTGFWKEVSAMNMQRRETGEGRETPNTNKATNELILWPLLTFKVPLVK